MNTASVASPRRGGQRDDGGRQRRLNHEGHEGREERRGRATADGNGGRQRRLNHEGHEGREERRMRVERQRRTTDGGLTTTTQRARRTADGKGRLTTTTRRHNGRRTTDGGVHHNDTALRLAPLARGRRHDGRPWRWNRGYTRMNAETNGERPPLSPRSGRHNSSPGRKSGVPDASPLESPQATAQSRPRTGVRGSRAPQQHESGRLARRIGMDPDGKPHGLHEAGLDAIREHRIMALATPAAFLGSGSRRGLVQPREATEA